MKKSCVRLMVMGVFMFIAHKSYEQSSDSKLLNFGTWQTFSDPLSRTEYPEISGRLCNFRWKDLELKPGQWYWGAFDSSLADKTRDSLPLIFMVYTEEDAPDWLYDNGVPKVTVKDVNTGEVVDYVPYYADPQYKFYFKRMITTVREHIEQLPDSVRKWIIGVQGCFGSTGDYIGYKGDVPNQYYLNYTDFFSLFKEFSAHYYNEYKNTNPKIYLLSNPQNNGEDQMDWLIVNCPNGWIKCGSIGKGYQLNDELDKSTWLHSLLNQQQNNEFVRSRSETIGVHLSSGWWNSNQYRNMFALFCAGIYWGLDWSNLTGEQIKDHQFDPALHFYNKYSGKKDPATSDGAVCALRDGLDAQDKVRFPITEFGAAGRNNTARYTSIANKFAAYGAKLEDPSSAVLTETGNLDATGINDVGWNIFPGNYERYLRQINANETSAGYWNIDAPAEPNSIYGRFGRGFDLSNGKTALYFDVQNDFLNNVPLNAKYPVSVEITYLDKGYGKFVLLYDAQKKADKFAFQVDCQNTGTWKKISTTIVDANFGNRCINSSDFYIKNKGTENVIFSTVELSRPVAGYSEIGFKRVSTTVFDSTCYNSVSAAKSLEIDGRFLNGTMVKVGPFPGFQLSEYSDSAYADSLVFSGYGSYVKKYIYIKFTPSASGEYAGQIPITGGGVDSSGINVFAVAVNSSPTISPLAKNISCFNAKDGSVNLRPQGGVGNITYFWTRPGTVFKAYTPQINDLIPATYNVEITSANGCVLNRSFIITEPAELIASTTANGNIICKNGNTTATVSATGGTLPYTGTGVFTVNAGITPFTVTDANLCTSISRITVANGTLVAPLKPSLIQEDVANNRGICGSGNYTYFVDPVLNATSYNWDFPNGFTIVSTNGIGTQATVRAPGNFTSGNITVSASNECGTGNNAIKTITNTPDKPESIIGPANLSKNQKGVVYRVSPEVPGVTYTWRVPNSASIKTGQGTYRITVDWGTLDGKVSVYASNDCASSKTTAKDINVTATARTTEAEQDAAESAELKKTLIVAPNPVKDRLNITFVSLAQRDYNIVITDIMGHTVFANKITVYTGENKNFIDASRLSSGTYMITFIQKNGNRVVKTFMKL